MPCPISFVVKNGSKAFAFTSGVMPHPLSVTASITYCPGSTSAWVDAYFSSRWTLAVSSVSLPPLRHGIARVDREVENGELELIGIGKRPPDAAAEHRLDRDLLAQGAPEQVGHAGDQAAKVERLRIERLLTRKGQQPLGQRLGAARAAHGVVGRSLKPRDVDFAAAQVALQGFEVADDDGEKIVEVMGDAARELSDALHLLGLPRALFGRALFREIPCDLGKPEQLAFCILDRVDDDARPEPAFVLADAPSLGFVFSGARSRSPELFSGRRPPGPPAV